MKKPFELNERVVFYSDGDRLIGTVVQVDGDRYWIKVFMSKDNYRAKWVHHKQCRRLKKKAPRRRIWVKKKSATKAEATAYYSEIHPGDDYIMYYDEFIEVRKNALSAK